MNFKPEIKVEMYCPDCHEFTAQSIPEDMLEYAEYPYYCDNCDNCLSGERVKLFNLGYRRGFNDGKKALEGKE